MSTDEFQWLTLIFSALGIILIPLLVMSIRAAINWSRINTTLREVSRQTAETTADQERRIRWLEENAWRQVGSGPPSPPGKRDPI